MRCLSILDPRNLPDSDQIPDGYGHNEIATLKNRFSTDAEPDNESETDSLKTCPIILNAEDLDTKWVLVCNMMQQCKNMSLQDFYVKHIYTDVEERFPNIGKLFVLALSNVLSSVHCERGCSCYNLTKTSIRNRFQVTTVNKSMVLRLEGPPL